MVGLWSDWRNFPDPREGEILVAPLGAGCYDLRLADEKILFGRGAYLALRMTSLLPKPLGSGTRNNENKRSSVVANLGQIEYRTIAFATVEESKKCEAELKANGPYRFTT